MTKQEEFRRIVVLNLQAIRTALTDGRLDRAMDRLLKLERLVKDHGQNPSIKP